MSLILHTIERQFSSSEPTEDVSIKLRQCFEERSGRDKSGLSLRHSFTDVVRLNHTVWMSEEIYSFAISILAACPTEIQIDRADIQVPLAARLILNKVHLSIRTIAFNTSFGPAHMNEQLSLACTDESVPDIDSSFAHFQMSDG